MLPVVHWITRRGRSTVVIGSNLHVRSAVDAHLASGDEIGVRRAEHCNDGCDRVRLGEHQTALEWQHRGDLAEQREVRICRESRSDALLGFARAVGHSGGNGTGLNRVEPDPFLGELQRERIRHRLMPPLDAAYADMYGCAKVAEVELKLTTAGSLPLRNAGMASRVTRKVPTRLIRSTCSKSASVVSRKCADRKMPAALTRASRPPRASTARATPSLTDSSLATSMTTLLSRPPCGSALATVSVNPDSLISAATTRPPSARMRITVACPMPEPPPVMRTRRSL